MSAANPLEARSAVIAPVPLMQLRTGSRGHRARDNGRKGLPRVERDKILGASSIRCKHRRHDCVAHRGSRFRSLSEPKRVAVPPHRYVPGARRDPLQVNYARSATLEVYVVIDHHDRIVVRGEPAPLGHVCRLCLNVICAAQAPNMLKPGKPCDYTAICER